MIYRRSIAVQKQESQPLSSLQPTTELHAPFHDAEKLPQLERKRSEDKGGEMALFRRVRIKTLMFLPADRKKQEEEEQEEEERKRQEEMTVMQRKLPEFKNVKNSSSLDVSSNLEIVEKLQELSRYGAGYNRIEEIGGWLSESSAHFITDMLLNRL
jgi:hypothetical protein